MLKTKTVYVCQACGATSNKWVGQCPECKDWNSLVEETVSNARRGYAGQQEITVSALKDIPQESEVRFNTGVSELDRVLGGGLVEGSVVLIGGDPGVGKSTLLLLALCRLSETVKSLYVTGEESPQQVSMRANRMGLSQSKVFLVADTRIESIIQQAKKEKPKALVIDSIQTLYTEQLSSAPGSVSQVRECAAKLVAYAKQEGVALFLVGHVTKDGALAGPRVLEHMVDCVLYFEGASDTRFRALRAIKNRFGAVNELGIFAMVDKGIREVSNPSAIFLANASQPNPGSAVMATWEGSRPLLVEIQALVDTSHLANPRRVCVGLDQNRLAMLLAVLHKHGSVATHDQDVYLNVVGGIRVSETGADLALIVAVLSSMQNTIFPRDTIVFGEVGLAGEIRPVQGGEERVLEAAKHGFKTAIVPKANAPKKNISGMEVIAISELSELKKIFSRC